MNRNDTMPRLALAGGVALILAACGGGGGGGGSPAPTTPAATAIPESLTLTAPPSAEASSDIQFGNSASSLSGLSFSWDFGDGKSSSEASPKHAFAKGGDYEVVLKISNAAGASREQRAKLSITNLANVKGLICSGANDGGWCWQQPRPSGNANQAPAILDASTAFSIGRTGDIFKTTDAGSSWSRVPSGTTQALLAIAFSGAKDGWIVGREGTLLRTSDGGASWSAGVMPDMQGYLKGMFLAYQPLVALDANRAVWKGVTIDGYSDARYTADGGKTWHQSGMEPTVVSPKGQVWSVWFRSQVYKSVDFGKSFSQVLTPASEDESFEGASLALLDDAQVLMTGLRSRYDPIKSRYVYTPRIFQSGDNGQSWTAVEPTGIEAGDLSQPATRILRAVATDKVVVAAFGTRIYRSTDGGSSWQRSNGQVLVDRFSQTALMGSKTLVVPAAKGILRSEDLGQTWTEQVLHQLPFNTFNDLRKIDDNTLSLRVDDGRTWLSSDQGKSWKLLAGGRTERLPANVGGAFFDARHGLLLDETGALTETSDGGLSWKSRLPGVSSGWADLQFAADQSGWLLRDDGSLSRTLDGGNTWAAAQRIGPAGFDRIGLIDAQRGWGQYRQSAGVQGFAVTNDGGQTWSDVKPPVGVSALHFGAGQAMVGYGPGAAMAVSGDGGKTWSQPGWTAEKVAAQDAATLWAVGDGGALRRSTDKGQTWAEIKLGTSANLRDIAFANAKVGWLVGDLGTVYATVDGGVSWLTQPSGTSASLTRVLVADPKTAWLLGKGGTLLATGNGGF